MIKRNPIASPFLLTSLAWHQEWVTNCQGSWAGSYPSTDCYLDLLQCLTNSTNLQIVRRQCCLERSRAGSYQSTDSLVCADQQSHAFDLNGDSSRFHSHRIHFSSIHYWAGLMGWSNNRWDWSRRIKFWPICPRSLPFSSSRLWADWKAVSRPLRRLLWDSWADHTEHNTDSVLLRSRVRRTE